MRDEVCDPGVTFSGISAVSACFTRSTTHFLPVTDATSWCLTCRT